MTRPPSLLPEEDAPSQSTSGSQRTYILMLWIALILVSLMVVTWAIIVRQRPGLIGLGYLSDISQTRSSFQNTEQALEVTRGSHATQAASVDQTLAALDDRGAALENQETQAALDSIATQTAVANANAQQATRNALDFEATQAAFQRQATQVELEFRGTQAALNRDATAAALGFATEAPSGEDVLTQTPQPTITAVPLFRENFTTGLSGVFWQYSSVSDWRLDEEGGLIAQRDGAWLLTQLDELDEYSLQVELVPLVGEDLAADYYLLLNVHATDKEDEPGGIALRLSYDGSRLTAAGLYGFTLEQMFSNEGLLGRNLDPIQAVQVDLPPDTELSVRTELREGRVVVVVNGELVLDVALDETALLGAVGLQVPADTRIKQVILSP